MNDVAKQTNDLTITDLDRLEDAILFMPPAKKAKLISLIYVALDEEEGDLLTLIHAFLAEEDES